MPLVPMHQPRVVTCNGCQTTGNGAAALTQKHLAVQMGTPAAQRAQHVQMSAQATMWSPLASMPKA